MTGQDWICYLDSKADAINIAASSGNTFNQQDKRKQKDIPFHPSLNISTHWSKNEGILFLDA